MSLDRLLKKLSVPPVPSHEITSEPLEPTTYQTSSPSSLSSPVNTLTLDQAINIASSALTISSNDVRHALSADDVNDWSNGRLSIETLIAFAKSLMQLREMDQGKVPAHYTKRANCKQCGPVWLWVTGEVQGCPWCRIRISGRQYPAPPPN